MTERISPTSAEEREELRARLRDLDTATLSDALDRVVRRPSVIFGLRRFGGTAARVAGPALTVELGPAGRAAPAAHLGARAIDAATGGEVIVVANRGRLDVGAWGGLLTIGAAARGVTGVLVDGACRDVGDLALPVFARGAAALSARGRIVELASDEPVAIAGVRVEPGDWIVADDVGAVVVPAARVADVLATAAELARRERRLAAALEAGRPATEVLGADYERMLDAP